MSPAPGRVEVVQTTRDLSQRLTRLPDLRFTPDRPRGVQVIRVDADSRYQRIAGIGAALTDTSAWLLADRLSPAARAAVLQRLFGPAGIHLSVMRLPIGASDFTRNGRAYSYDEMPPGESDPRLAHFSVAHDDAYIIPVLRQILTVNPDVELLASPWSPPSWMKANDSLGNRGDRGVLLPADYGPLADYLVKFIEDYARRGVPITAITPQNEPGQASAYPGTSLSMAGEAKLIAGHLGPALAAAHLSTKIYAFDYKWLYWRGARELVADHAVARAISGLAWHCYDGDPTAMTVLHRLDPRLDETVDECSSGVSPGPPDELLIAAMRNWASSVMLWNLALDPQGGPVMQPNHGCDGCTSVVTVNERTRTVSYNSDYYQLGQFSDFVRPGARRIGSNHFVVYNLRTHHHRVTYATPGIDDVALQNPDGGIVLMVHNNARQGEQFAVQWRGRSFRYTLLAGATVTFSWA